MDKYYYLDAAATTPLRPSVKQAMIDAMDLFGNPSSQYTLGTMARLKVDWARQQVADLIGAEPDEIFFTGSATEANNIVIHHLANKFGYLATTAVEHPSVHNAMLYQFGGPQFLSVDNEGMVADVEGHDAFFMTPSMAGSFMLANNETGLVHNFMDAIGHCDVYHTDITQYVPHFKINVHDFAGEDIGFASFSAHKFGGPKGVGVLYINRSYEHDDEFPSITPLIYGGGQEHGIRSGTENVLGIIGTGQAALELNSEYGEWNNHKRNLMVEMIHDILPDDCRLNFMSDIPVFSVYVPGVKNSLLAMICNQEGVYISTGSACHGDSEEPSRVLLEMGLSKERALQTIRISPPHEMDVNTFIDALTIIRNCINTARKL